MVPFKNKVDLFNDHPVNGFRLSSVLHINLLSVVESVYKSEN